MRPSVRAATLFKGVGYYTHHINGATGNDGNAGTSAAPFATLAPLITAINALPDNGRLTAHVAAGTYTDQLLNVGASVNAGVYAAITFADGVVMQGTSGVDQSWLDVAGATAYTLELIGLGAAGLRVTGFDTGSGNGLGVSSLGGALLISRNVHVDNCVDGVSLHFSNSNIRMYDCSFEQCSKAAAAHVHTGGSIYATRTIFKGQIGALNGVITETTSGAVSANSVYEDCDFIPANAGQTCSFGQATLRSCRIGSLTVRAGNTSSMWGNSNGPTILEDCYIHAAWDISTPVDMTRCYGRMSRRMRPGSYSSIFRNCVFVDGAAGATADSSLFNDNSFTGSAKTEDIDCIYTSMAVAFGSGYTATQAGYFSAAASRLTYGLFYANSTDIDADVLALGSPYVANNITGQNPLLGPCNSYAANDYKVQAGSPTLGAGSGGGDIGLGLAA